MTLFHAFVLGLVQGFTEFLPISSDGHLVVVGMLLSPAFVGKAALGFDVFLHGASLCALLLLYGRTWWRLLRAPFVGDREHRWTLFLLLLTVIPGGIVGLLFRDLVAGVLRSNTAAGMGFLVTALVLLFVDGRNMRRKLHVMVSSDEPYMQSAATLSIPQALFLGIAQAIAILPGVSRSGLTISAGRLCGLTRRQALDFSFLMAVPIIAGATLVTMLEWMQGDFTLPALSVSLIGFASSFVASVLAIITLRRWIARISLAWFAVYLIPLSIFLLFF